MKTSAGIYFDKVHKPGGKGVFRQNVLICIRDARYIHSAIICLLFAFLASCTPLGYGERTGGVYPETRNIVASWYGPDFHGKPTSSGERYDMYSYTCAHREYPFGTRLRVLNLSNGKTVNCTVNDRGPFVSGRDLDLSYACAKDIGMLGPGTATVRIDYLGRDTAYIRDVKYSGINKGPFTIQVGSFRELPNATRMKAGLEFKYSRVYITEADIDGSRHFRVKVGRFSLKDDAFRYAKTLAEEGYSTLITRHEEKI